LASPGGVLHIRAQARWCMTHSLPFPQKNKNKNKNKNTHLRLLFRAIFSAVTTVKKVVRIFCWEMLWGVMILCHFEGCLPASNCQRSRRNKAKLKTLPGTCTESFYSSGVLLQTTPDTWTRFRSVSCRFGRHVTRRLGCYN